MLPWSTFGHMTPFFHLAVAFASADLRVSFLSTLQNTRCLPEIPSHLTSLIWFVDLPLPPVDGLPDHAEATVDLPADKIPLLKKAYDLLQDPIKRFLTDESSDFILHDYFPHWAIAATHDVGVPCVFILVFSGTATAFQGPPEALTVGGGKKCWPSPESMMSLPNWLPSGSTVAFRRQEVELFYSGVFVVTSMGLTDIDQFWMAVEGCDAVTIRNCLEYEGDYLDVLRRLYRKPVIPLGLISPPPPATGGGRDDNWARV